MKYVDPTVVHLSKIRYKSPECREKQLGCLSCSLRLLT